MDGKFDEAYALLSPYAEEKLQKFQAAQKAYEQAFKDSQQRAINGLSAGNAPGFDFGRYRQVAKAEQSNMVGDYVMNAIKNDPAIVPLRNTVMENANVVPVAL